MLGNRVRSVLLSVVAVMMVSLFPVLFLFAQNAEEVSLFEILLPLGLFFGSAMLVALIIFIFVRSFEKTAFITCLFVFVLSNYALIEKSVGKVFTAMRYWHFLPICLFVLLHLAYIVHKKMSEDVTRNILKIVSVVFGGLILFNVVIATPTAVERALVLSEAENEKDLKFTEESAQSGFMPNVYYFIFDEYSGFNTIEKIYDYDNSDFAGFLEDRGFVINRDSYNDYISTVVVTANLVNLSYNYRYGEQSDAELLLARENNLLVEIFKANGYEVRGVGEHVGTFGIDNVVSGDNRATYAQTIDGIMFSGLLINNSVLYPLCATDRGVAQQAMLNELNYFHDIKTYQDQGVFTLSYFLLPHQPFIFDRNGGMVNSRNSANWTEKKYYLDQFVFTTKQIEKILDSILENDPNSIIVIQSDHSARAASEQQLFLKLIPFNDMKNSLNVVYYMGEDAKDLVHNSGVNTLRMVLNRLFDMDYEILEVPEYEYRE